MKSEPSTPHRKPVVVQFGVSIHGSSALHSHLTDANAGASPPNGRPDKRRTPWRERMKAAWFSAAGVVGTVETLKGLVEWVRGLFSMTRRRGHAERERAFTRPTQIPLKAPPVTVGESVTLLDPKPDEKRTDWWRMAKVVAFKAAVKEAVELVFGWIFSWRRRAANRRGYRNQRGDSVRTSGKRLRRTGHRFSRSSAASWLSSSRTDRTRLVPRRPGS